MMTQCSRNVLYVMFEPTQEFVGLVRRGAQAYGGISSLCTGPSNWGSGRVGSKGEGKGRPGQADSKPMGWAKPRWRVDPEVR